MKKLSTSFATKSEPPFMLYLRLTEFGQGVTEFGQHYVALLAGLSRQCQILVSSACHSSGPISVNPSRILLVYGNNSYSSKPRIFMLHSWNVPVDDEDNLAVSGLTLVLDNGDVTSVFTDELEVGPVAAASSSAEEADSTARFPSYSPKEIFSGASPKLS